MMMGFDTARSPIISGLGITYGDDPYSLPPLEEPYGVTVFGGGDVYPAQQMQIDAAAGADVEAPWYQEILQFGSQALQAYTQFRSQDALMELNVERARRGLPPIDPTAYGPAVGVGLDARTRELVQYALIGGGLLMVFLIMKKR